MQKVLGLDIGSYSIKAVEIVNTFKSYEISNFYENIIPQVEELDPDILIPICMEQLFKENDLRADRIITAMPGQYISSRIMPFNFSDPRKVETAVLSEVEDAVPFNMEDMIVDHQLLGTMDGRTLALVVMTRKNFLRSFLEHLQRISIDPKLVDVDSLAFYNLSSYMDIPPGEVCGIVDVGHEKTAICLVQNGVLRMFRSINLGGRYITEFLARDLEVDFSEAQRVKHRVSRLLTKEDPGSDLSESDRAVAERITLASNAIVKELGRTLYAFKNWEKAPVSKLFISGGTSRIQGFDRYLREQLEVTTQINRLDQTTLKINPDLTKHMAVMPQSVAIGMRAVASMKRHSQINLRKGEFAYIQNYEQLLKSVGTGFKVISVALVLLCVSYSLMYFFYSRQIGEIQQLYTKEFTTLFPDQKKKIAPATTAFMKIKTDAKTHMTKEISARKNSVEEFVATNSASSSLLLLKDISKAMPKEVKVDVTQYNFTNAAGGGKLILQGETNNFEAVASIVEALKKVSTLSGVEEKQSAYKPGSDNKVVSFTINATYSSDPSQAPTKA